MKIFKDQMGFVEMEALVWFLLLASIWAVTISLHLSFEKGHREQLKMFRQTWDSIG